MALPIQFSELVHQAGEFHCPSLPGENGVLRPINLIFLTIDKIHIN